MCGLFAWISNDKKNWTALNRFKFQLLGCEMDARGGDGVGIAYDNRVVKSNDIKLFNDFWRVPVNTPFKLEYPAIIGHDRKSSVGANTYENTQPIFFEFDKENNVESILAHNGTISNYKELYENHKLQVHYSETEIATMSDSQVLALLLHKVGWSILEEYVGSAAFLYMKSSEPGVMYIYHGKSPTRKNVVESEERPLFYVSDVNSKSTWICSTKAALEKIVELKAEIKEVPFNKVIRIEGSESSIVAEIDRSKSFQYPPFSATRGWQDGYQTGLYDEYPHNNAYMSKKGMAGGAKKEKSLDLDEDPYSGYKPLFYEAGLWKYRAKCPRTLILSSPVIANGQFLLQQQGHKTEVLSASLLVDGLNIPDGSFAMYFWRGNLCKGRAEYINCMLAEKSDKSTDKTAIYRQIAGNFKYPYIIPLEYGSLEPGILYSSTEFVSMYKGNAITEKVYTRRFSGIFEPPMRVATFRFEYGKLVDIANTGGGVLSLNQISDVMDKFPAEFRQDFESAMLGQSATKEEKKDPIPLTRYASKFEDCANCTKPATSCKTCGESDGEVTDDEYQCPNCCGTGEDVDGNFCADCLGIGILNAMDIASIVDEIGDYTIKIMEQTEAMKYLNASMDLIEEGLNAISQHEDKSSDIATKLRRCKTILER